MEIQIERKHFILILVIIGFLVFFNSVFNGFVWDDEEQVVNNSLIHSLENLPQFFMGSTFQTGGAGGMAGAYYKPLMTTAFALLYFLSGGNASIFHFFQIVIHIVNAILVFLLFERLFKKGWLAFFLSLIFLVHPINCETVVYVSSLQDILFFFFGLSALLLLVYDLHRESKAVLLLVPILLLCSLLSKETGILFLLVSILYLLFFVKEKKKLLKHLSGIVIVCGVYLFLRFIVAGASLKDQGLSPISRADLLTRLITGPKIVFFYLKTFFFPKDLAIAQQWIVEKLDLWSFWVPLIIDALFFIFVADMAWFLKKKKLKKELILFIFFLIWFVLGLGLHLQIIPLDMTVADRWFYFPIVGLLGMIGVLISRFKINDLRFKNILIIIAGLIVVILSVRTIIRTFDWRDGLTLFSHDVEISKDAFDLENNVGTELFRVGRYEEAKPYFIRSTELAPYWWTNWNNLGAAYQREGDLEKAKECYQKAIENGGYYLAYENLAGILLTQEKFKETRDFTRNSLRILPYNSNLWLILALAEYKLGELEEAKVAAYQAYVLSGDERALYLYQTLKNNEEITLEF